MSNEVVPSNLMALLESGKYAAVLDALARVEEEQGGKEKRARSTIAKRKAALAEAVKEYDVEILTRIQTLMQNYVDDVARIAPEEPRQLTRSEAHVLMNEAIVNREIGEFVAMRYDTIRELALMSIDADLEERGKDSTVTSGKLPVPTLGKVFCKEGAGMNKPGIDEKKLKQLLGDDADRVFVEEVIPEQRVTKLDEDALAQLASEKPEVVEYLREALVPGKLKSPRFIIRDYNEED